MHKLERLILESFAELTEEREIKTLGLEELPASVRKNIEDRYGISKWPEKDFVSSNMTTYFKTTSVNDRTGNVGHKPINLPSFEGLYSNFSDIVGDIKQLMNNQDVRTDKRARELFELIKTNFRKLQSYLRTERPDQYELMKMRRSMEEAVGDLVKLKDANGKGEEYEVESEFTDSHKQDFFTVKGKKGIFDKLDLVKEEEEPTPEEEGDQKASKETVLEDATDTMIQKFPTLKATLIKLQTEDFKEFVDSIDWISPRPTEFRINLKNGQDYILKWTGTGFEAQIMGKRYYIDKINDYQQALDKLAILYKEGPIKGAGEAEPADTDSDSSGGSGGDFPGGDTEGGGGLDDAEGGGGLDAAEPEEGGADLTGEPVDFEEPAEEPAA
tara:strand:- start:2731 stop:3885 length:1155 start_codon:yes stop_codon:yes gene_type:complete